MKVLNHVFELNARARWGPSHFRIHKYALYNHIVWWKFSLIFGQPHLVETQIHKGCNGRVHGIGEDLISYCEDCETIVEGETEWITEEEWEKRHGF